eukprot:s186_g5.t1
MFRNEASGSLPSHVCSCLRKLKGCASANLLFFAGESHLVGASERCVKQLKALLLTEELDPGVLSDALKGLAQLQHLDNEFLEASSKQLALFARQVQGAASQISEHASYQTITVTR